MDTIRSLQWSDDDKEFVGWEKRVAEAWGLDKGVISELHQKPTVCRMESPISWSPPSSWVFKVNLDGASKGNPREARYGEVCQNCNGEILQVFYGNLGHDTNNSAELEGMIQGV